MESNTSRITNIGSQNTASGKPFSFLTYLSKTEVKLKQTPSTARLMLATQSMQESKGDMSPSDESSHHKIGSIKVFERSVDGPMTGKKKPATVRRVEIDMKNSVGKEDFSLASL